MFHSQCYAFTLKKTEQMIRISINRITILMLNKEGMKFENIGLIKLNNLHSLTLIRFCVFEQ